MGKLVGTQRKSTPLRSWLGRGCATRRRWRRGPVVFQAKMIRVLSQFGRDGECIHELRDVPYPQRVLGGGVNRRQVKRRPMPPLMLRTPLPIELGVEFYIGYMSDSAKLSHTAALILQTVDHGCSYGFDIMDETGLPSGTVYPALRRMEKEGWIASQWEAEKKALAEQRPARKYYKVTRTGAQVLEQSQKRYPLLGKLSQKSRR